MKAGLKYNNNFKKRYGSLNQKQRLGVDTIYGPVLVVAGPGSGKTELLGVRTANILKKTDTPAESVLSLTLTNTASANMRKRMIGLIGDDAHRLPIYTFHSFCQEIIENNPDKFFSGADYTPADQFLKMDVIESILKDLDSDDPLASYHPEMGFVYLRDIENAIFCLQEAGINPKEFASLLEENRKEFDHINSFVRANLEERVSPKMIAKLRKSFLDEKNKRAGSLFSSFLASLEKTIQSDQSSNLSLWKQKMIKNEKEGAVFRDHKESNKLSSLQFIYEKYRKKMKEGGYYSFSDMLLNVCEALEENESLLRDLQEKYLFMQVDEFQDTSGVQMRLLNILTSEDVEEKPNICVVGDDDQAIYRFQGADVANIIGFRDKFENVKVITLDRNYRSGEKVIEVSKSIIKEAQERLENYYPDIEKKYLPGFKKEDCFVKGKTFFSKEEEYSHIAKEVKKLVENGQNLSEIAVIARHHNELKELSSFFSSLKIPFFMERRENVLEKTQIKQIIDILQFANLMLSEKSDDANALLPEILSYPFWKISREKILEIALKSREQNINWMECILKDKDVRGVGCFLLEISALSKHSSVQDVIDVIIGNRKINISAGDKFFEFKSNFKEFYFGREAQEKETYSYLDLLSSLRCLYESLKKRYGKEFVKVGDAIYFIDFYKKNGFELIDKRPLFPREDVVSLITAHSSKGEEFENVFIISCLQNVWLRKGKGKKIKFPLNLPIEKAGDERDDQIKLFYVAITRAKKNLYFTAHNRDSNGKELHLLEFTRGLMEKGREQVDGKGVETSFKEKSFFFSKTVDERKMLIPFVEEHALSATGYNKFLNIVDAGPRCFLEESILRFPQKKTKELAYGNAVHSTISTSYCRSRENNTPLSQKEFISLFLNFLKKEGLSKGDYLKLEERGVKELSDFYKKNVNDFCQDYIIEFNFKNQGSLIEGVKITGKIDKMKKEKGRVTVYDFKTGKPFSSFQEKEQRKKIKAWQYKNQLIFYKLLVENASYFRGCKVEEGFLQFVKPDKKSSSLLSLKIEEKDVRRVEKLIKIIGGKIKQADFSSADNFKGKSLKDIVLFEDELLNNLS